MAVTPRGFYSIPVSALRSMLSQCASFQKLVRASSAEEALTKIVVFAKAGDVPLPRASIGVPDFSRTSAALGLFKTSSKLLIEIDAPTQWVSVVDAATTTVICAEELIGLPDGFFNGWTFKFPASNGMSQKSQTVADFDGAIGEITLAGALSQAPEIGENFRLCTPDLSDTLIAFMNTVGDIQAELEAQSGAAAGNLFIRRLSLTDYGLPPQDKEIDDYCAAIIEVEHGV